MMLHRFASIQKFAVGGPALPDRTIVAIASDETLDRAGNVMVASGCDATNYKRNAVVLRDHDPTKPIGTASVIVKGNRLEATIKFAPAGVSPVADETFALVKAGVLTGVSIGFQPIESEPLRDGGVASSRNGNCSRSRSSPSLRIPRRLVIQRSYRASAGASARQGLGLRHQRRRPGASCARS